MFTKSVILRALLLFVAGVAFVACGGGNEGDQPSSGTLSSVTAALTITSESLELMPLTAAEFGGEFLSLEIDDSSGYQTSDDVASNTIDRFDSAADIEAGGWVASYLLNYADPSFAALEAGTV